MRQTSDRVAARPKLASAVEVPATGLNCDQAPSCSNATETGSEIEPSLSMTSTGVEPSNRSSAYAVRYGVLSVTGRW
jgi:hypothetical protein